MLMNEKASASLKLMKFLVLLLLAITINYHKVSCENTTEVVPSPCKSYNVSGENFTDLFPLPKSQGPDSVLHFQLKGSKEARIYLTTAKPHENYEVHPTAYTIILGDLNNHMAGIKLVTKNDSKFVVTVFDGSNKQIQVLSDKKFVDFWIHLFKNGTICVALEKRNDSGCYLKWDNPEPADLQSYSFGSAPEVSLEFLHDCPEDAPADAAGIDVNYSVVYVTCAVFVSMILILILDT